jgi:HEAT repeat protein
MGSKTSRVLAVCALLASPLLVPGVAHAQPKEAPAKAPAKKPDAPAPVAKVDVAPLVKKLESGDPNAVKEALDELRIAGPGGAGAAAAVAKALAKGLSLPLTESAIETLGDLEAEAGTAALAQYATHRNLKVRRAAVKALARTKGPVAIAALRRALSDADPVVRGNAASGLGALKAKDAVPDLFVALDHRVNEAAASIGQLCNAEQCERLTAKVGSVPFDVVTSGLDPVLFRPTADASDDLKVKVVGRLRELGTLESNKFLRDVQKRWPSGSSPRVRQAIDQAVMATAGGK